jgi:hypothetical protein
VKIVKRLSYTQETVQTTKGIKSANKRSAQITGKLQREKEREKKKKREREKERDVRMGSPLP